QIAAIPLLAALLALATRSANVTRKMCPILVWLQLASLIYMCWPVLHGDVSNLDFSQDFSVDRLSACFLLLTTFVCACSLSHASPFFAKEAVVSEGYTPADERIFYCCAVLFLMAMSFVFVCNNLGILWICIEGTTLSSAALVYFSRTKHSLEATWKYL